MQEAVCQVVAMYEIPVPRVFCTMDMVKGKSIPGAHGDAG